MFSFLKYGYHIYDPIHMRNTTYFVTPVQYTVVHTILSKKGVIKVFYRQYNISATVTVKNCTVHTEL